MKSPKKQAQVLALSRSSSPSAYHVPVLLNESLAGLQVKKGGTYVDCTYGGGGHSKAILEQIGKNGRLVAFDQDEDVQNNLFRDDGRILFVPHNFRHLQRFLRVNGIERVEGVLADLGVSSHQFDQAERGFSIRYNASLDMRMDRRQPITAAHILNQFSEQQMHKMFEQFGEVSNSKTLAHIIFEERKNKRISSIDDFKNIISPVIKGNPNKYLAQVFQALRMEVNDEMNALKELLEQLPMVLGKGGRACIITFHSIEDRVVKTFFKDNTFQLMQENPFANVETVKTLKPINKKPVVASREEVEKNPRARSAKLRVAERI